MLVLAVKLAVELTLENQNQKGFIVKGFIELALKLKLELTVKLGVKRSL